MTKEDIQINVVRMGRGRFIEIKTEEVSRYYSVELYTVSAAIADFVEDWC